MNNNKSDKKIAAARQLIAELASQALVLEKSERDAIELNTQLAAERAARANAESAKEAVVAPPPTPVATAEPDPVPQQSAVPEPRPVVVPDVSAETAKISQAPIADEENSAPAMSALSEGQKHFARGDLEAARRAFERAAKLGLPEGALAVGTTFDPVSLAKAGISGPGAPNQARRWYRRAHAMAGAGQQP